MKTFEIKGSKYKVEDMVIVEEGDVKLRVQIYKLKNFEYEEIFREYIDIKGSSVNNVFNEKMMWVEAVKEELNDFNDKS